jgi:MFS family permease
MAVPPLTRNQVRGFWAAWAGWALDGMDSFLYALVLVPAMRDLLPRSGIRADQANIGFYGGLLFAIFLTGWGFAFLWGPIADRFGRVRTLILTILCYSLFTFLGSVAANIWQLAAFRFAAGMGIGGEWTLGGVFIAEEWPEARRKNGAAFMHTGYYFGTFLAAIVNYLVGTRWGWRAVFAVGGTPALLVAFIRYGVVEPKRWVEHTRQIGETSAWRSFAALFSPEYRRRTLINAALLFISMVGLWAGSAYVPASVTYLASLEGLSAAGAARMASNATMLLSTGTILGCLLLAAIADRLGRRGSLALYFALMFASIALAFGYVFYLPASALGWFMACLFALGVGGANFSVYTLWLPEQYRTECRGSAFAFATSAGRFLAAGATFLVGAGVSRMHSIGTPVALTSLAFLVGLALIPWAEETKGKELPA